MIVVGAAGPVSAAVVVVDIKLTSFEAGKLTGACAEAHGHCSLKDAAAARIRATA
jgi:hypothetical protein